VNGSPTVESDREQLIAISLAWEKQTGNDSIPTVERIYDRSDSGAIKCVYPGCSFTRRDAVLVWRHVHTGHGNSSLPPRGFQP
jgi:hypothetical protein